MYLRGTISIINVYEIKHILNNNNRITIYYMNANILKFTKIVKINKKFSLYLYFIIFLLDCIIFISEMLKYNKTYHHLQSRAKVK